MKPNDNVTCDSSQSCTFSCQGENYDVNADPSDGCEVADSPTGNHTQATAKDEGMITDCDTGSNTDINFTGILPSDATVHANPSVAGFDPATGSAPDFLKALGVGNVFCQNDLVVFLAVTGSTAPSCYKLTVVSDKFTYSCTTDSTGACSINHLNGQFSDNTEVYFEVSRTCSTPHETAHYALSGHF
jgi:hypothetical protein